MLGFMLHDEAHGVEGLHLLDGIVTTKQMFVDDTCFLMTKNYRIHEVPRVPTMI